MRSRTITIRKPIWKTKSIGIADYKIEGFDRIDIKIDYADQNEELLYPHTYSITTAKLITYPTQVVGGGVLLYVVPISELEIKEQHDWKGMSPDGVMLDEAAVITQVDWDEARKHIKEMSEMLSDMMKRRIVYPKAQITEDNIALLNKQ